MSKPAVNDVQRELPKIAAELTKIELRMEQLAAQLPRSPWEQDMLDDYLPRDLTTELRAVLEINGVTGTREIVAALRRGAEADGESLKRRFVEQGQAKDAVAAERLGPRRVVADGVAADGEPAHDNPAHGEASRRLVSS